MNELRPAKRLLQPGTASDLIALILIWGLALVLVNPNGDFPLNDDWSYGIAVKRLLEQGHYLPTPWTSMTLFSQVLWGALFSYLFGFSFEVLRYSTLVLALAGICSLYLLIRQLDQPRWLALLGAGLLAFNTLFFSLAHSFMTDVPFVAFTVMALLFLLRFFSSGAFSHLLIGTLLAIGAILCRQTGLFIPLAFGCTYLLTTRGSTKNVMIAFAPMFAGAGALLAFQYWMNSTGRMPDLYDRQVLQMVEVLQQPTLWPMPVIRNTFTSLLYLGFFLSPLLILLIFTKSTDPQTLSLKTKSWVKRGVIPLSLLLGTGLLIQGRLMPVGRNILHKGGVGLNGLWNEYLVKTSPVVSLPDGIWMIITMLSVLGGAILLMYLLATVFALAPTLVRNTGNSHQQRSLFFLMGALTYFLPFMLVHTFFDRYLLVLFLLLMLFLLSSIRLPATFPRGILVPATSLLVLFAAFSITLTHDYLAWNRTRWDLLAQLQKQTKLAYDQIHGGFEYNGLYFFGNSSQLSPKSGDWWSENPEDYQYILSFREIPGYQVISAHPSPQWLHPQQQILILCKKDAVTCAPDPLK